MNWNDINVFDIEKEIIYDIDKYKSTILAIANKEGVELNWINLIQPLEDVRFNLDQKFNIISHLHSVKDNHEVREVYDNILPKLSELHAEFLQNYQLQRKLLQFKNSNNFINLSDVQQKIIENLLLDFKLAGVDLSIDAQQRYKTITTKISKLSDEFAKNLLDASSVFRYYIEPNDQHKIAGLPLHIVELCNQTAIKKGYKDGWFFTLDLPCIEAVLRHAEDRQLRKIMYIAHITKSSDITKQFDNSNIMESIINLRIELAELLGFNNYSEYSLSHKMAKTTTEVESFLEDLANVAVPIAKQEFLAIKKFVKQQYDVDDLEPWDIAFYAEKYKQFLFNLSEQELRNYFPIQQALSGIFRLANTLFGIIVEEVTDVDVWDADVKFYKVLDNNNNLRGFFYIDLYFRVDKKCGAWMAECISRHKLHNENLQYPIAFLVTNFAKSPLLYHEELLTLLHEFGHTLHHVLTKVDYISASGCNGVAWDAVELPSQFMEKWGYDWQFLQDISMHYETKAKISKQIFDSLINIKNYNVGMFMVRQLEFAMFDFKLHMYKSPVKHKPVNILDIQHILDNVRSKVTVVPVSEFNRFQHAFSHIFAGSYAAGYYSYSWAEVLASDAFIAFKDQDRSVWGAKFLHNVLENGGSKDAMDLYIEFRGKKPDPKALLEYKGLMSKIS